MKLSSSTGDFSHYVSSVPQKVACFKGTKFKYINLEQTGHIPEFFRNLTRIGSALPMHAEKLQIPQVSPTYSRTPRVFITQFCPHWKIIMTTPTAQTFAPYGILLRFATFSTFPVSLFTPALINPLLPIRFTNTTESSILISLILPRNTTLPS